MNFNYLDQAHRKWNDILVIGKTIERDGRKYHILGMTLAEEAKLYVIEPYIEPNPGRHRKKGCCNQRKLLKEHTEHEVTCFHCGELCLGNKKLQVQSSMGGPLGHSAQNYEEIQLFFDMLHAGWEIPEWLKYEEWDNLQLVTLTLADVKRLPKYSPEMPITIKHRPKFTRHMVEKTITLSVGKSRSFHFVDHEGDTVLCHINHVTLIDVWKEAEEQFNNPKYTEHFSAEQLQEVKEHYYEALEQNCPQGMCYIGIEYECSKNLDLQFYSKEFLRSCPEQHGGSATFLMMRLKPDKELGTHNLPLKGCAIQTPVSPDTLKIPAELFAYFEKTEGWEEHV